MSRQSVCTTQRGPAPATSAGFFNRIGQKHSFKFEPIRSPLPPTFSNAETGGGRVPPLDKNLER